MRYLFITFLILFNILLTVGQTVIAVEDNKIYIEVADANEGDAYIIYESTDHFIHPVTGEKIPRDQKNIATVKVTKVYDGYCEAVAVPDVAVARIKEGMFAKKMTAKQSK